jgi:hypothetical protein
MFCMFFVIISGVIASDEFCFFPPEIQGEYRIQNAVLDNEKIQYSEISITSDFISPYGYCYSRNGTNNIIVTLR